MNPPTTTLTGESAPSQRAGRISKTIGYYAVIASIGLTGASLGPTLPGLAEHTRTHLSEISFLFMARSLGYLLGSFFGGRLYDRMPGHPVMALALVTIAVMMALAPLASLLWILTALLLILGLVEGALDVGANTLLIWVHGHDVPPFMNALHFFFGVGAFLSPVIIAQAVLVSGDITWAYWILALLVLPVVVLVLRTPSPEARAVSDDEPGGQVTHGSAPPPSHRGGITGERLLVILIALFFFLYVGAEVSFGGWIFTYAIALDLASQTTAAYLTSAFWGSFTVGRLLGIPVAARFRPRSILLSDLVGCLASLGVILLWPNSLVAVWLGTLGTGFFMASIFPITLSVAERRLTITGRVASWFFVGGSAGAMSLPWLIGQLFESIGPRVTMFALLIDVVLAMGIFAALILHSTRSVVREDSK